MTALSSQLVPAAPPSRRRRLLRMSLLMVALSALPLGGFLCDDSDSAIEGTTDGTERWIIHLDGPAPDLTAYREAVKKGPAEQAKAAKAIREAATTSHAAFAKTLSEAGGKVIEHWWMTNAVTVEIPAGTAEDVAAFEGVKRVSPDTLLE